MYIYTTILDHYNTVFNSEIPESDWSKYTYSGPLTFVHSLLRGVHHRNGVHLVLLGRGRSAVRHALQEAGDDGVKSSGSPHKVGWVTALCLGPSSPTSCRHNRHGDWHKAITIIISEYRTSGTFCNSQELRSKNYIFFLPHA